MESDSRTVVVSGVPDVLPPSRMTDKLTIHFQTRMRSHGGDVEVVRYPTNMDGVAFVTFDHAEDAERVVLKEQQVMEDREFPDDYLLTVFPFTTDVFSYVSSATVDLSIFGRDQSSLIQSLRSAHRSLRFQPSLLEMKSTVEGPFSAVQVLRQDLIRRAGRLKSDISAVKLRETPLNPTVISHHGVVGSVSCSGSEAKPGPASSNRLPPQTTGKATGMSNAKTHNASSREKVPREVLALGSNISSDDEEEERAEADLRRERGVRSSSLSDKEPSQQPGVDISEKPTRSERSPASEVDQEDTCIWVDSHTFRYIERFDKKEFDRCLEGVDASIGREGTDLVRILLTERGTSKMASRIQHALQRLKSLQEFRLSTLRVQQIDCGEEEKQEVVEICDDVNLRYDDVLYVLEDSCVKVVGPSVSSFLFCRRVEERRAERKHTVKTTYTSVLE